MMFFLSIFFLRNALSATYPDSLKSFYKKIQNTYKYYTCNLAHTNSEGHILYQIGLSIKSESTAIVYHCNLDSDF